MFEFRFLNFFDLEIFIIFISFELILISSRFNYKVKLAIVIIRNENSNEQLFTKKNLLRGYGVLIK